MRGNPTAQKANPSSPHIYFTPPSKYRFVETFFYIRTVNKAKKIFSFLLALHVLFLTSFTCLENYDTFSPTAATTISVAHDCNQEGNNICDPFCQCSCCPGFVVMPFCKFLSTQYISSGKQFILYSANFSSAFFGSHWQPPKIS